MVHRTMGLPHKSEPKNSYCVIWVKDIRYIARSMCTCPDTKKGEMPLKDIPPLFLSSIGYRSGFIC